MSKKIGFLFFVLIIWFASKAQTIDTLANKIDSLAIPPLQTSAYQSYIKQFFSQQNYINTTSPSTVTLSSIKKTNSQSFLFYTLVGLALLLGFINFFFGKYFSTLLKVFFNTTLRQSQLTDQLLQAKLPSLLCNIFFVLSGGVFIFVLLNFFNKTSKQNNWQILLWCILALVVIYVVKYLVLRFSGWLTANTLSTNTYIFIIFLINKILGIFLLPFTIFICFTKGYIAQNFIWISFLVIGFLFLLRFLRSYGLLQNSIKISRFHFLIYLIGIEILPLIMMYKGLSFILEKNI